MNEKQDYLRKIFVAAMAAGLCKTQKEFAELLEIDRTGLSAAMNGNEKNLTDSLIKKVRRFAQEHDLEGEQAEEQPRKKGRTIEIPEETLELYTSLAKSVDRLSSMVERMMPGSSVFPGGVYTTPKNSRTEK